MNIPDNFILIKKLLEEGKSVRYTSAETNVPRWKINKLISHYRLETRNKHVKVIPVDYELIDRAFNVGISVDAIATKFGIKRLMVAFILEEFGYFKFKQDLNATCIGFDVDEMRNIYLKWKKENYYENKAMY